MNAIRTILHATDFSPSSDAAFGLACSLAHATNARVIVLHVIDAPVIAYAGVGMAPPPPAMTEDDRETVLKQLRQIQSPVSGVPVEHQLEVGDPATGVLEVARERGCDLIVIGTHGRTGLGRLLMGSVAEKIVRTASCPVLTVKTPLSEDKTKKREGS